MTKLPRLAALAVVLREDKLLLVRRKNEPNAGHWGFPGGHVDFGESVGSAACHELFEETTINAEPGRFLMGLDTIIPHKDGTTAYHFYMVAVECIYTSGER
ncbi:MAG: NUDIX domain-containing protein [Pseudomonadota bacterium]